MTRILISRPDKIGDVVLALHGAKQIKQLRPDWEIYLHASEYTLPLVKHVRFLDGVVTDEAGLDARTYDVAVDLMAKSTTARLFVRPSIKKRYGNSARWFSYLYHKRRYVRRSRSLINEAEYNWKLLSLLDDSFNHSRLTATLAVEDFSDLPEYSESEYVVLMPGVAVSATGWPLEEWLSLGSLLVNEGKRVLYVLGPAEKALVPAIEAHCAAEQHRKGASESSWVMRMEQPASIMHALSVLKSASHYVGPSTGMTHLASVCGLSGVALYPENRSMHPRRWLPFRTKLQAVSLSRAPKAAHVLAFLDGLGDAVFNPLARGTVSGFVVCKNEEKNIRRCLDSLAWCDEVVVVDSGSSDSTLEIAREYTDRIFFREWTGHSEQKQFALEKCQKEWVLNIDADEEVSDELRGAIEQTLSEPEAERKKIAGYELNRLVYFLGKWWEKGGWYPEYRLRFFQRALARWGGVNPHEKVVVTGKVKRLGGHLHHFTYTDIPHQILSLNNHSTLSARCLYEEGVRARFWNILLNPPFRFIKFYVMKRGFREGFSGFLVGIIEAMYTFFKYVKLWELQRAESKKRSPADKSSPTDSYAGAHRYTAYHKSVSKMEKAS